MAHDNICQCEEGSGTVGQVTDNQSIRVTSVGEEVRGISVSCSSHVSVHMCMMRTDFLLNCILLEASKKNKHSVKRR